MPKLINYKKSLPAYLTSLLALIIVMIIGAINQKTTQKEDHLLERQTYKVIEVVDGDTVKVEQLGTIRLIGINTPETRAPGRPVECFGRQATEHLTKLINGKEITLEQDSSQQEVDRYGRILAYVHHGGRNINLAMIEDGYAYEYTYNVPYKYQQDFKLAQDDARQNNRGLWASDTCNGQK